MSSHDQYRKEDVLTSDAQLTNGKLRSEEETAEAPKAAYFNCSTVGMVERCFTTVQRVFAGKLGGFACWDLLELAWTTLLYLDFIHSETRA